MTVVATAPTYSQILQTTIASMQATAIVTEGGQTVLLDMSPGSYNLALAVAVAANVYALFLRQDDVQAALDYTQAVDDDLDRLVARLGVTRQPATAAEKPVLIGRQQPAATQITVPVNWRFTVQTARGPVDYLAVPGQTEPPGVALTVQAGSQWGWVIGEADSDPTAASLGTVGNTPTGLPVQMGSLIAGLDTLRNPAAGTPTVPTYSITGTPGSGVRYYRLVGRGVTGTTLPGPVLTVSNAPSSLGPSSHVDLAWSFGADGGAVQPVSYDVLYSADNATWLLLGNTAGTTFSDTGMVPQSYALPQSDTSNWGVGGADRETNAALRERAPTTIAARSVATGNAVGAAVANVAGVASAYGIDVSPGIGSVYVVTDVYPPSQDTLDAMAAVIDQKAALGAKVTALVIQPTTVSVSYTLIADSTTVADPTLLYTPANTAIIAYLAGLTLGAPVHFSAVISAMMSVVGVSAVQTLTLSANSTTYSGNDVPGIPTVVYRTDAGHITPAHA